MRPARPTTSQRGGRPRSDAAPANLHEAFRYEKEGRLRVYSLRHRGSSTELWITTANATSQGPPSKRVTFDDADDIPIFLSDIEQTLRLSGWRRLTA